MIKFKTLVSFAVVLGALMVTAAPALAEFQALPSKESKTSGTFTTLESGALIAHNAAGEPVAKVKCEHPEGEWKIRSTGKILEETKGPNQQPTKRGPHQQFQVKWQKTISECATEVAGLKLSVKVEECQLQIHQQVGVTTNVKGDVLTACVLKIPANGCVLTIPAANEATGTNFQLSKVDLENSGENDKILATITGITIEAGAGCAPVVSNSTAQLTGLRLLAEKEIQV